MSAAGAPLNEFVEFPKIPRLKRGCVISEKIDGTNAQIIVTDDGQVRAASRNRFITPDNDNYGFAAWVEQHKDELLRLGPGRHYGEWWGAGIQRRYGMNEKVFSLFNVARYKKGAPPECCRLVPVLYQGDFTTTAVDAALEQLRTTGSVAAPGFMEPEGIVVYHAAANQLFKVTLDNDALPKSQVAA